MDQERVISTYTLVKKAFSRMREIFPDPTKLKKEIGQERLLLNDAISGKAMGRKAQPLFERNSSLARMEMACAWLVIVSHRAGNLLMPEQAISIPLA